MRERESEWTELMRSANSGDSAAYHRLLNVITPVLRATAQRGLARAGQPTDQCEDIVQEILLAVHLKRHTWDPTAPFGPWLFAIARNKLIDSLRLGIYRTRLGSAHVMGGCGMSEDPKLGVTDSLGRHHQLENLSIHDGSLFPTSIGANPQLSIYGLTAQLASLLAERLKAA